MVTIIQVPHTSWMLWELQRYSGTDTRWLQRSEGNRNQAEIHWLIGVDGNNMKMAKKLDEYHPCGRVLVLNRYAQSWSSKSMRNRLRRFGVPVSDEAVWMDAFRTSNTHYVRTVTFWVYQCEVIAAAVSHSTAQLSGIFRPKNWTDPPLRRLARIAERTAYALGWDTCSVTIQSWNDTCNQVDQPHSHQSYALDEPQDGDSVIRVAPVTSRDPAWVREAYEDRIQLDASLLAVERRNERNGELTLTYGLDAEFILYDSTRSKIISASRYFYTSGEVGCDAVRVNGKVIYPLLELRPNPTNRAEDLVAHVRQLMKKVNASLRQYSNRMEEDGLVWFAGSKPLNRFAIGTHLHLAGKVCTSELIRTLDTYVALPCSLLETQRNNKDLRRGAKYGALGDVRQHHHHGAGGFEYRTLWNFLVDPTLSEELLHVFGLVVHHYWKLPHREAANDDMIVAYSKDLREEYRQHALDRMEELSMLASGRQRMFIQQFAQRIRQGWTWNEHKSVREAWTSDIRNV